VFRANYDSGWHIWAVTLAGGGNKGGHHEDDRPVQGTTGTGWRLLVGGQVGMEAPRHVVIEDTFTHLAHHRGQLTVYLRLNEMKVPSIYGPTADDKTF